MIKRSVFLGITAMLLAATSGCHHLGHMAYPLASLQGYGHPRAYRTWYQCDPCDECNNCGGPDKRIQGIGCGKPYWHEWFSDPPFCNDPCDCGNDHVCKSKYWGAPAGCGSRCESGGCDSGCSSRPSRGSGCGGGCASGNCGGGGGCASGNCGGGFAANAAPGSSPVQRVASSRPDWPKTPVRQATYRQPRQASRPQWPKR